MAVMAPPFYGRIVFPVKRKDGRERFLAMTDQAADLLLNRNFGPSKSPGFGDDICTGTADGKPCVHIANPDHKRIITVISSEAVIEQLTDFLLQFFEGVTKAMVNTAGPAVSDFVATNQAENLLLEVQTLRQFFKCLKRYGKYLDDTDTDDSCRESE
jgi:hypothetical protein